MEEASTNELVNLFRNSSKPTTRPSAHLLILSTLNPRDLEICYIEPFVAARCFVNPNSLLFSFLPVGAPLIVFPSSQIVGLFAVAVVAIASKKANNSFVPRHR